MDAAVFPKVPKDLLEALSEKFPDKAPRDLQVPDRLIWADWGSTRVVQFLRAMFEAQTHPSQD